MSTHQQQFIQTLIETGEKLSLEDFFKKIHSKFYSNYDISFIRYFLQLKTQEEEQINNKLEQFINNLDIRIGRLSFSQNIRPYSNSRSG
jgi:hypothetical protein